MPSNPDNPTVVDCQGQHVKSVKNTNDGWQLAFVESNYFLYVPRDPTPLNLVGKILTNIVVAEDKSMMRFMTSYKQDGREFLKDPSDIIDPKGTWKIQAPEHQVQTSNRPPYIDSGVEVDPRNAPQNM